MSAMARGSGFSRQTPSMQGPDRVVTWTGNLVLVAMVLVLGWQLGPLTWQLAWQQAPVPSIYQGQSPGSRAEAAPPVQLDQLDLFGAARDEGPVAQVISNTAPKTNLQLVLEGVVVGAQRKDSGAIVADNQGDGKYYKVGDTLPGQAKLVAVESHRILLRRNGRIEALPFVDRSSEQSQPSQGGITASATPGQVFQEASSELAKNPQAALQSAGLRPARPGQASGYVYDGSNPMLSSLNLKKGDVILSINGHDLGEIQQDRQLMEQWYRSGQLQIEVERGGAQFTINVPIPH